MSRARGVLAALAFFVAVLAVQALASYEVIRSFTQRPPMGGEIEAAIFGWFLADLLIWVWVSNQEGGR